MAPPLECPSCGTRGEADERFCPRCGTPLVLAGIEVETGEAADPARDRARKVHPPYAEGRLVRVARAQNQPEAELMQGMLLDAGVPSLARRAGGFDVPDFLAAGPRDVLVPLGGVEVARELLGTAAAAQAPAATAVPWVRVLAFVLATFVLALVAVAILAAIL